MKNKEHVNQILDELRAALHKPSPVGNDLKWKAIDALAGLPEKDNAVLLSALDAEYKNAMVTVLVCGIICGELAKRGEKTVVETICELLADPLAAMIREDLVEYLGQIGDPSAVQCLAKVLSDDEIWVRAKAAHSLGELGTGESIPLLIRLLDDEAATVREYAIEALEELKADECGLALIRIARDDDENIVRAAAARALGELRVKAAIPVLKKIIDEESDEELVTEAAESLKQLNHI